MSDINATVVVGRFQSPTLTEDQKNLLNYAVETSVNEKPTVILGLSPLKCTAANPLDYEARKAMIEEAYPGEFNFRYIKDQNSDAVWSSQFDDLVNSCCSSAPARIVGSVDGFYNHYDGAYKDKFEEFPQTTYYSTAVDVKHVTKDLKSSPEWRAGVAYATQAQFPTVYSTVDCAIFHDETFTKIYLARKKDEELYRFVGGFASPKDDSFEDSALRESKEETNLDCEIKDIVCTMKVDDFRYRNETSKIITHLYVLVKKDGRAQAQDDIAELRLFHVDAVNELDMQQEHRPLLKKLKQWLASNR